jgi:hypothetical protein
LRRHYLLGERPPATNPGLDQGTEAGPSEIKKSKHSLAMTAKGKGDFETVLEAFIPDTSTDEVAYDDVYKMAVER